LLVISTPGGQKGCESGRDLVVFAGKGKGPIAPVADPRDQVAAFSSRCRRATGGGQTNRAPLLLVGLSLKARNLRRQAARTKSLEQLAMRR
jgi:hypothetical protein